MRRRWWAIIGAVLMAVVLVATIAAVVAWQRQRDAEDREREAAQAAQGRDACELANQILRKIEGNRMVTEEVLRLLAQDRRDAAVAALNDGTFDDASRRAEAARQYDLLRFRLQPVDQFDCQGGRP